MPTFFRLLLRWGFYCLALLPAAAEPVQPEATATNSFLVWNTQDAELLPQSSVIALTQTRDGYLWLGTMKGLVRFDGLHAEVFFESDTIVFLYEDRQRGLWVGTEKSGVKWIHDGQITEVLIDGGPARLVSATEDRTGAIWLYAADGRLARGRDGRIEKVWPVDVAPSGCRAVTSEATGEIWIATDRNLLRVVSDLTAADFSLQLKAIPVEGKQDFLVPRAKGGFWQFASGRIFLWNTNGLERDLGSYPWMTNQTVTMITSAVEDDEGKVFIGTLGAGVFQLDVAGNVQPISRLQGLSHNGVLSLCIDREGNLWVGTDGGGANRVTPRRFEINPASIAKPVQSVCEDAAGGLWFAVNGGELNYWNDGKLRQWGGGLPGPGINVRSLLVDLRGPVWLGAVGLNSESSGLFQFFNDQFRIAPGTDSVRPRVFAMLQDRSTNIWMGAAEGLARWDGNSWRIFTTKDGLSVDAVRAIAEDRDGTIWIGTDGGGLNSLRDGKFTSFRQKTDGLPSDFITALFADTDGALWIGTSGGGLAKFQAGKWTRFGKRDGLVGTSISYLIEDDEASLWIGSNEGLMRIAKSALNLYATSRSGSLPVRTFGRADGLPTKECTSGSQPAAWRSRSGKMWFPTTKGLIGINPKSLRPNTNPPPVIIDSVLVDGESQSTNSLQTRWASAITVPAHSEVLEIHFTSLNLGSPERARFQYRLDDHESRWIDTRGMREARFTKLPHGEYRFQVRACNEDGYWSPAPATLEIIVLPPFWRTWWFQSIASIMLVGAIVGTVYFISTQRLQRQLASMRQHEALEKERARIARDLHDQLGANLTQVNLLGEMVGEDKHLPDEVAAHAEQICKTARTTSDALDEIVWAANPSNDTLEGLVNYACKYAQEYLALADLRYRLDVPPQLPALNIPPDLRHNVFLAFKESVNNVVKHARATEARIRLRFDAHGFIIEIEDDGRGPAEAATKTGRNGLRNMRKRMEDVGGSFEMTPGPERGTIVRLTAPLTKR